MEEATAVVGCQHCGFEAAGRSVLSELPAQDAAEPATPGQPATRGFSYGVAIAQVDNIIHVRYSSLAAVTRAELNTWLTNALRSARHGMAST